MKHKTGGDKQRKKIREIQSSVVQMITNSDIEESIIKVSNSTRLFSILLIAICFILILSVFGGTLVQKERKQTGKKKRVSKHKNGSETCFCGQKGREKRERRKRKNDGMEKKHICKMLKEI